MSSHKIYVGNLSYGTTEAALREFFNDCARDCDGAIVEVKIITDRHSGQSKGFGFITFDKQDAADKAVATKNGDKLDGRALKVNIAQERTDRDRGGSGSGGRRGGGNRGGFGGDSRRSY